MDFRTQLGWLELDRRDLPSVTALPEPEMPTAPHSPGDLHGVDVATNTAATAVCGCQGGLTDDERKLLEALQNQLAAKEQERIAAEGDQIKLEAQRAVIDDSLARLNAKLVPALKAHLAATQAFNAFILANGNRGISLGEPLHDEYLNLRDAVTTANGVVEGLEIAVAALNTQRAELQRQIEALNAKAVTLREEIASIRSQIAALLAKQNDNEFCDAEVIEPIMVAV